MEHYPKVPMPKNSISYGGEGSSNLHMDIVQTLSSDLELKSQIELELEKLSQNPMLTPDQEEEKEVYTQAIIKINKAIKTKETLLGKMNSSNKALSENYMFETGNISGLNVLISETVSKEITSILEAATGIGSGNWFRKPKPDALLDAEEKPVDVKSMLANLVTRKNGQANLNKKDMELLDRLTKWMKFIPGGTQYRRSLSKYIRSKRDPNMDPYRDFRKYSYDNETMDESPEGIAPEESETFYHGTSFGNLKPGSLILPPSKTGKQSEKDRKKNLDQVFFTKDPRSALVYAGRAAQSLGGTGAVYVVEPQGPVSLLNATEGTTVYYAPYAKVIRRASKDELAKKKKV